MKEVKISLQELLSLYTGGRPFGITDISKQRANFVKNYNRLIGVVPAKGDKKETKKSRNENLRNIVMNIEQQYPEIKKIKKACKAYMTKYPALYDEACAENTISFNAYQWDSNALVKEARSVLGSAKEFTVRNKKIVVKK